MKSPTKILSVADMEQRIRRIACQVVEDNDGETEMILIGIRENGFPVAEKLSEQLALLSSIKITLAELRLNKSNPQTDEVKLNIPAAAIEGKVVLLVDDVANSGRTLLYAMKPLLNFLPKKIQVAVLVDRKHKQFPVSADFVGISLSTGMQEHVTVEMAEGAFLS